MSTIPKIIRLYHFTRRDYLASILENGLDKGDVPLSADTGVNGISLTEIPDPGAQRWNSFITEKLKYRLTVELQPDPLLMRWKYVPERLRMEKTWWRRLNDMGRGEPYKWWVYFASIPPEKIMEIWDCTQRRSLSKEEMDILRTEPRIRGQVPVRVKLIPFQEALRISKSLSQLSS